LQRLQKRKKRGLDRHRSKYSNFRKLPNAMQFLCLYDIQDPRLVREYNTTHRSVLLQKSASENVNCQSLYKLKEAA